MFWFPFLFYFILLNLSLGFSFQPFVVTPFFFLQFRFSSNVSNCELEPDWYWPNRYFITIQYLCIMTVNQKFRVSMLYLTVVLIHILIGYRDSHVEYTSGPSENDLLEIQLNSYSYIIVNTSCRDIRKFIPQHSWGNVFLEGMGRVAVVHAYLFIFRKWMEIPQSHAPSFDSTILIKQTWVSSPNLNLVP